MAPSVDQSRGVTVEEIVSGTRCSPFTLKEFEEFLIHQEHSVENLLFTVWFRSYCERFDALPEHVKALSPAPERRFQAYGSSVRSASLRSGSIKEKDSFWRRRLSSVRGGKSAPPPMSAGDGDDDGELDFAGTQQRGGESTVEDERKDPYAASGTTESTERKSAAASQASLEAPAEPDQSATPKLPPIAALGSPSTPPNESVSAKVEAPSTPNMSEATSGSIVSLSTALGTTSNTQSHVFPAAHAPQHSASHEHAEEVNVDEIAPPALQRVSTQTTTGTNDTAQTGSSKLSSALRFNNLAPLNSLASRVKRSGALPEETPPPFSQEIELILTTFILPGASRELNLDSRLRKWILDTLKPVDESTGDRQEQLATTHPDVFRDAQEHCYGLMEHSLTRYLGWNKGNINRPKVLFWYGVGTTDFLIGLMIALVIMFRVRSRWWRIWSCVFIDFGVMQSYSAGRYFCSQVHGRNSRQLYPWELTEQLENDTDGVSLRPNRASTFVTNSQAGGVASPRPNLAGISDKHQADLQASLPFLFDDVPPEDGEPATETKTTEEKDEKAAPSKLQRRAKKLHIVKSKWSSTYKQKDGRRMPVFGPERVVEDPYIKRVHNQQIREILIVGFVVTVILEVVLVAIPPQY